MSSKPEIPEEIISILKKFKLEETNHNGIYYKPATIGLYTYYVNLTSFQKDNIIEIKGWLNPVTTIDLTVIIKSPNELETLLEITNR